ncbi:MAG TPA: periplasmic heavy metal sensor [Verrucomicrobiae bacterium]|nr:periplasmic heavy metal sensor [Verrucomicrobiae bacterium]
MKTLRFAPVLAVISIMLAGFAMSAPAQTPAQRTAAFAGGERFFPALDRVLTDAQRKSFHTALLSQADKIPPLEQKILASRRALLDEIAGGKFDETNAQQNAKESAQAEAELTLIVAKALSQVQPPLSAQQIEQLKNFQPGPAQSLPATPPVVILPPPKVDLPPPLPRDSNDLPIVTSPQE